MTVAAAATATATARHADPADQDIASLLTVIITTSPTPSAPCTDLLSAVLASFRAHCPALLSCPVTVVFDTYERVVSRARLKKGGVTTKEAQSYAAYKDNVRQLVRETWASSANGCTVSRGLAEYGLPHIADNAVAFTTTRSADGRLAFVEPDVRLGFGLAVRTAVRAATTPYVWIQQHDWTLTADIPLTAMLEVMQASEETRPPEIEDDDDDDDAKSDEDDDDDDDDDDSLARDIAKLAVPGVLEVDSVISYPDPEEDVPVRYICLPSVRMLRYATSAHVARFPMLRSLTTRLKRDFYTQAPVSTGHRLPMTPLFFWHDKTHLASTTHYLERVFANRLALSRGDFIEDHIGQRARTQMKNDAAAWRKWACWLYYPDNGNELCLRHLQGRTWRGEDKEREMRDIYRERNRSAASAAAEAARAAAAKVALTASDHAAPDPDNLTGVFDEE